MENDSIEQACERLLQTSARVQRERRAFMATQPRTSPCRVHPDCQRQIDEKLTASVTAGNGGKLKAGYSPCPKCLEDEKRERLQSFGVPENLLHATFENFTPDSDAEAGHAGVVKSFCDNKHGFLVMLGGYGTGKSHLAVAGIRVFDKGWFVKQSSLLFALRATYRDKAAFDPIHRAQSARLFVLDDVGISAGGRDELPLLHEILDHRHGERLPTIITSNLPWENLTSVLGERMGDRLRESAFRILTFAGTSHRRDARDRYFEG
jgi:DNA replication protein DnaC